MEDNQPTGETMSEGSGEASTKSIISEDFQKASQALLSNCNEEELDYLQKCCSDKEQEMTQSGAGDADDSTTGPAEYNDSDMPKD